MERRRECNLSCSFLASQIASQLSLEQRARLTMEVNGLLLLQPSSDREPTKITEEANTRPARCGTTQLCQPRERISAAPPVVVPSLTEIIPEVLHICRCGPEALYLFGAASESGGMSNLTPVQLKDVA